MTGTVPLPEVRARLRAWLTANGAPSRIMNSTLNALALNRNPRQPAGAVAGESHRGSLRPVVAPRRVELVLIETHGDRDQASALSAMGGFGVFTKAIQNALSMAGRMSRFTA